MTLDPWKTKHELKDFHEFKKIYEKHIGHDLRQKLKEIYGTDKVNTIKKNRKLNDFEIICSILKEAETRYVAVESHENKLVILEMT